jgi:multiple sugar transport system substrate-binding protein
MFSLNPIAVAELMSNTDDYWYCPFAYGYSNYSREGYAKNLLLYTDLVDFNNSVRLRSTIGGTGLAVSSFSRNRELAVQFAQEIVSAKCQATFYVQHGGQPGHKSAWLSETANKLCNDYFKKVLPAMENGYVRPRYNGYLYFQDHAGDHIRCYVMEDANRETTLDAIDHLYRKSREVSLKLT